MRVEFPLNDSQSVTIGRPTEKQLFALSLLRRPGTETQDVHRFITHVVGFLESLAGPDEWNRVIGLALSGDLDPMELLQMIEEIVQFDWNGHDPKNDALVAAIEREEIKQGLSPAPPQRPAPRVVSGG